MLNDILDTVAAALTRKGLPGDFTARPGACAIVTWHGARRHEGDAFRALLGALAAAGFRAERVTGIGARVFTDETRAVGDVECVHSAEPDESTERECELTAAAAE